MAIAEILQNYRRAEIEIGADFRRTVDRMRLEAAKIENVAGSLLLQPEALSAGEIEGDDRIGAFIGGIDVSVARAGVEPAEFYIDRRRAPYRAARRAEFRVARAGRRWTGYFGDAVSLPDQLAAACVDGGDVAAERAAGIRRIAAGQLLVPGERDVQAAVVKLRCARDSRGGMRIDFPFPDELAIRCVERVEIGFAIAEISERAAIRAGRDRDRVAHGRLRFERPDRAAGRGVERVDGAVARADEQAPGDNRRLAERRACVRDAERPFQFHVRDAFRIEARVRLVARIDNVDAPAVPVVRIRKARGRDGRRAGAEVGARNIGGHFRAEERGDRAALGFVHLIAVDHHRAGFERLQDFLLRFFREYGEHGRAASSRGRAGVARGAVLLEERGAVGRGLRRRARRGEYQCEQQGGSEEGQIRFHRRTAYQF